MALFVYIYRKRVTNLGTVKICVLEERGTENIFIGKMYDCNNLFTGDVWHCRAL